MKKNFLITTGGSGGHVLFLPLFFMNIYQKKQCIYYNW